MKIGIITFWQSNDNYGQILQCYALQQQLLKLGHEPYLIRYDIEHRFGKIKIPLWKKIFKVLLVYPVIKSLKLKKQKQIETALKAYNILRNKERDFENFRKEHFLVSDIIYSNLQHLQFNPPIADAYIVGSDQVWAHLLDKKENQAMFLNFGSKNIKRIAYAPSFSMYSYPTNLKSKLKENLGRFNHISVRERTGVDICKELGYDAQVVADPTMLIKSEDYLKIASKYNCGTYIYLYYLNICHSNEVEWVKLHEFAEKLNIKIIATPSSGYIQGQELFCDVEYRYASIPQWISLINNAKLVVTTSFHGVVFCILHHTPFIYFLLKGKFARGNNRVVSLCNMLGLSDRIWSDTSSYESLFEQNIKWEEVDKKLNFYRLESVEFLNKALS